MEETHVNSTMGQRSPAHMSGKLKITIRTSGTCWKGSLLAIAWVLHNPSIKWTTDSLHRKEKCNLKNYKISDNLMSAWLWERGERKAVEAGKKVGLRKRFNFLRQKKLSLFQSWWEWAKKRERDCWFFKVPGKTRWHRIRKTGEGKAIFASSSLEVKLDMGILGFWFTVGVFSRKNMKGSMEAGVWRGKRQAMVWFQKSSLSPTLKELWLVNCSCWVCLPLRQRGWTFITPHHYPSAALLHLCVRRHKPRATLEGCRSELLAANTHSSWVWVCLPVKGDWSGPQQTL